MNQGDDGRSIVDKKQLTHGLITGDRIEFFLALGFSVRNQVEQVRLQVERFDERIMAAASGEDLMLSFVPHVIDFSMENAHKPKESSP
jgi:hypothetical protein